MTSDNGVSNSSISYAPNVIASFPNVPTSSLDLDATPSGAPIIHISSHLENNLHLVIDIHVKGIHKLPSFSNKHYMNARSKISVFKPRDFSASLVLLEPKNWKDALRVIEWMDAMQKKFDTLLKNGT